MSVQSFEGDLKWLQIPINFNLMLPVHDIESARWSSCYQHFLFEEREVVEVDVQQLNQLRFRVENFIYKFFVCFDRSPLFFHEKFLKVQFENSRSPAISEQKSFSLVSYVVQAFIEPHSQSFFAILN